MPAACFRNSAPRWAVVPLPPEPKESGRPSVFLLLGQRDQLRHCANLERDRYDHDIRG